MQSLLICAGLSLDLQKRTTRGDSDGKFSLMRYRHGILHRAWEIADGFKAAPVARKFLSVM
jgi:hypothetical protein